MKMYDERPFRYALVSWIGSFTGIMSVFLIAFAFEKIPVLEDNLISDSWVVGSVGAFGAQTVLLFALPTSPVSQPWNCVFGSMVSALIGVAVRNMFVSLQQVGCPESVLGCDSHTVQPSLLFLSTALANSVSIVVMHLTDSVHPPAGAFAFIGVNAAGKIRSLGYFYSVLPVGIGSVWLVFLSWVVNNYVNRVVEYLFGDDIHKEEVEKEGSNNTGFEKDESNKEYVEMGNSNGARISPMKSSTTYSNLTNRNYPSGSRVGAWLRPFRST